MSTTPMAYPLHWPEGLPRSKPSQRSPFKVSLSRAVADLKDALRLFGKDTDLPVTDIVISSNVTLGEARPADPGVAVYFRWDGEQRCIAVDRYPRPEDNVRAVYSVLEARRQELRHGGLHIVRAAFKGFVALPAPPASDWRSVLGVDAGVSTMDEVDAAWRALARSAHPDAGGSNERMAEINAARNAARWELCGG